MREDGAAAAEASERSCAEAFVMTDERHLMRALELARRGLREAHPNPRVGAVVVAGGRVVGEGYHRGPGTQHAEAVAIDVAGPRARGATLYVTLEPCCHTGRTGPCTDRIIAAGVARVVVGTFDPNPAVDGRGVAALRAAGLDVAVVEGDLRARCEALNEPFARFIRTGLPLVTYKAAASLDGKVAAGDGGARWISSPESRRRVHAMRAAADAVMIGAGTLRRDDPRLTVRDAAGPDPVRVVVSRGGQVPVDAVVFATAHEVPTLVLTEAVEPGLAAALVSRGVEVVRVTDLRAGLAELGRRGLIDVLCEGGPTLAGALLEECLIDRVAVFVAPLLLGRGAPDLVALPAAASVAAGVALRDAVWTTWGPDVLCEARVAPGDGAAGRDGSGGAAAGATPAVTGEGDEA
jgi:diaminohydroxyphosphoribosylaminopyrimidine deaminase/5-amino-6-(5-phosphoribosylamino)uracil reductase